jgi:hypothetical protein
VQRTDLALALNFDSPAKGKAKGGKGKGGKGKGKTAEKSPRQTSDKKRGRGKGHDDSDSAGEVHSLDPKTKQLLKTKQTRTSPRKLQSNSQRVPKKGPKVNLKVGVQTELVLSTAKLHTADLISIG